MIRRLNIVVAEDTKGKEKVLYVGRQRAEAQKVFDDCVKEGKAKNVMMIRNPQGRNKRPASLKLIAKDAASDAKKAKAAEKAEADPKEQPEAKK